MYCWSSGSRVIGVFSGRESGTAWHQCFTLKDAESSCHAMPRAESHENTLDIGLTRRLCEDISICERPALIVNVKNREVQIILYRVHLLPVLPRHKTHDYNSFACGITNEISSVCRKAGGLRLSARLSGVQ